MQKEISIKLLPEVSAKQELYTTEISKELGIKESDITGIEILKRSIDARQGHVKILMRAVVYYGNENPPKKEINLEYKDVSDKAEIIIVGAGPAGLFAALELIQLGLKPIVIERGKQISERKRDVAQINRNNGVNPDSNYCFGEGGAGTFSDGKLYTRSKKRGSTQKVLDILTFHGADNDILIDAHPHIGTNNLPRIIKQIRETILSAGGQILFNTRVADFIVSGSKISGVITQKGDKITGKAVILATGHSARDIYELLHEKKIILEAKSFAMGVRVEHPQDIIDSAQYSCRIRDEYLPAASYSLVSQARSRGVYSFCMCPGGFIVPAATAPEEIVVNGMSPSRRNSYFANSGMVVEIKTKDFPDKDKYGELAGLKFQQKLEKMAYLNGGQGITAPAQALNDFIKGKVSPLLPETSYNPGVISSPLHFWLPENIGSRLRESFKVFGEKMKGFDTNEAIILGVESRTSSPVRIPRDKENLNHPQIKNLYPCGEGAGFAGGIVSAAVDGIRCAIKISETIK